MPFRYAVWILGHTDKSCFLKYFLEWFFCRAVGKLNPKFCFTPSVFLPSSLLPLSSLQGRRVKEITHQPLPAALIQVLSASASALNLGVIPLLVPPLLTNLISMASSNTSSSVILKDGFLTKSLILCNSSFLSVSFCFSSLILLPNIFF